MLAYKVTVNGAPVATVGMKEDGLIFLQASWIRLKNAKDPVEGSARFSISGLRDTEDKTQEHLDWFYKDLKPGDKITLELVETATVDPPSQIRKKGEKPKDL